MKPALKLLKDQELLIIDGSFKDKSTAIWLANTLVRLNYAQIQKLAVKETKVLITLKKVSDFD